MVRDCHTLLHIARHLSPGPVGACRIVALHLQAKKMADQKVAGFVVVLAPTEAAGTIDGL